MGYFADMLKKAKGKSDIKSAKEGQDAIKNGTEEEKKAAMKAAQQRLLDRLKK